MSTRVRYTAQACRFCGVSSEVWLDADQLRQWQSGVLIQDAMPDISSDERELLISGTHAHCWIRMFGCDDCNEADLMCDHNRGMTYFGGKGEQV